MAHDSKKTSKASKAESECNVFQQLCVNSSTKKSMNISLLDNCCLSISRQHSISPKNSATNTIVKTHHQTLLPMTQSMSFKRNSDSRSKNNILNCGGASVSTVVSSEAEKSVTGAKTGSRRIFTPQFKLQVLESYRYDNDCKGNQRATARKYGIHRRQIQKWLQCENTLKAIIANNQQNVKNNAAKLNNKTTAPILSSPSSCRHLGVVASNTSIQTNTNKDGATYSCFTLMNSKYLKSINDGTSTKSLTYSSSSALKFECSNDHLKGNHTTPTESISDYASNISMNSKNNAFYKSEDFPLDLSCRQIRSDMVARPIALKPLQPSLSGHNIPLYSYNQLASSRLLPNYINMSNQTTIFEISNDPIDLSLPFLSHKRKLNFDNVEKAENKPVKLFRPYLEDSFETKKIPIVYNSDSLKFNLNNAFDAYRHPFLMRSPSFSHIQTQPCISSTLNDNVIMNASFQMLIPSQASPVSGYDSSTSSLYSFHDNERQSSDEDSGSAVAENNNSSYISSHCDNNMPYSSSFMHDLEFKLYALNCYYNDNSCKRNEKLVAKKLNTNCKIIEKWLRQEKDLRHQQKQYDLQILS